jgi:hypothetical protein
MKFRIILAAAAAPAALAGILLGTAGQASAATQAPVTGVSAYFYGPSGQTLGGPQPIGTIPTPGASVQFSQDKYLALVTEKANNADLTNETIHITGQLDQSAVADRHNDPTGPQARVYFEGSSGGANANSPDGYQAQQWWAHGDAAVLDLTKTGHFDLWIKVAPTSDWSNWNGQSADANPELFGGAASHVRQIGLSFGSGHFFETGVEGTGGLTITNITAR